MQLGRRVVRDFIPRAFRPAQFEDLQSGRSLEDVQERGEAKTVFVKAVLFQPREVLVEGRRLRERNPG